MKAVSIVLIGLLSLGFVVETPETKRQQDLEYQAWRKQIERVYDLPALRTFLIERIKALATVDGIDLSKSRVDPEWSLGDGVARCGDWLLINDPGKSDFALRWTYAHIPNPDKNRGVEKNVSLQCAKKGRDRFEFLSASRSDDEYVVLLP